MGHGGTIAVQGRNNCDVHAEGSPSKDSVNSTGDQIHALRIIRSPTNMSGAEHSFSVSIRSRHAIFPKFVHTLATSTVAGKSVPVGCQSARAIVDKKTSAGNMQGRLENFHIDYRLEKENCQLAAPARHRVRAILVNSF